MSAMSTVDFEGASSSISAAASSLPEQVAKLAAANQTLTSSLQQAHTDLAQLLVQRDELSDDLRGTVDLCEEMCSNTASWYAADLELTKRRAEQLRDSIDSTRTIRQRMDATLRRLESAPLVDVQ
jgi:prefoldin subunit 5